jgi:hypothetical protein
MSDWAEVGDRVFVRRYAFYDQNIGVVLGDAGVLVIDTRVSHANMAHLTFQAIGPQLPNSVKFI